MIYHFKSRFKADKQRKASIIQKWGKARCTMNAARVPCWDCFWSSLAIDWNTKDLIRGGKCNMLWLTPEPIPTIQFLSPVESHLRVKFFLGTGFYVELFASFLVLSAEWNHGQGIQLWFRGSPEIFLQGAWGTRQELSLSTFAATGLVSSMLLPLHGNPWECLPCPRINAGVKHLRFESPCIHLGLLGLAQG